MCPLLIRLHFLQHFLLIILMLIERSQSNIIWHLNFIFTTTNLSHNLLSIFFLFHLIMITLFYIINLDIFIHMMDFVRSIRLNISWPMRVKIYLIIIYMDFLCYLCFYLVPALTLGLLNIERGSFG